MSKRAVWDTAISICEVIGREYNEEELMAAACKYDLQRSYLFTVVSRTEEFDYAIYKENCSYQRIQIILKDGTDVEKYRANLPDAVNYDVACVIRGRPADWELTTAREAGRRKVG